MYLVIWFLAALSLVFGIVPFIMTFQFWRYTRREIRKPKLNVFTPKTALIVPCKGTDLNFAANIAAFLSQDYKNYEVIFVTATKEDPAFEEIEKIIAEKNNGASAKLLVAGIHPGRGQKMTNMLKGIDNVSQDTEVYAFMDADIGIYPNLLSNLVHPLQDPKVGASSGIWVFRPLENALGSILKFVWGSGAILMSSDRRNNLAIAAVACMKKEVFTKAGIRDLLNHTVSDTMAFTQGVRSIGLEIHFEPTALIISDDKSTLSEVLGWTNRLAIFNRVYNRPFWWKVFLVYCIQNLLILIGGILLLSEDNLRLALPASIMFGLFAFQILHAFVTFPVIVNLLDKYPTAQSELRKIRLAICLLAPFGGILTMINSLNSLRTNVICWRGIRYKLKSATETEVLAGGAQ